MRRQSAPFFDNSLKAQDGKLRQYRVVKGFRGIGTGRVAISPLSSIRLGLTDRSAKKVDIGGFEFHVAVRSGLEDDVVAIMEADRDKAGIALGDRVVLVKAGDEASLPDVDEQTEIPLQKVGSMVVAKGDQADPDTPPTVRVSVNLLKRLGIQDGANGAIAANSDGTRHDVVLRKSDRSILEDQIAVRKKLRDALKVDTGDSVTLWVQAVNVSPRRSVSTDSLHGRVLITDTPIVELDVDAIVNAANTQLRGGGGVDGAIHDAAGPELRRACRVLKGCKVGRVKMTEGYDLSAKYVFHAVGPQWEGGRSREHELLASCYREALSLAKKQGIKTIAFPCISTGVYGFPLEDATIIAFREILSYVESNDIPETIYLCPFTEEEEQAYQGIYKLLKADIPVDQIFFVSLARSGSDDDSVELSAKGAKALSVKKGAEIRLAAGDNTETFRVSIGESAYPERRFRLNAKARKKLGIEKGDAIHIVGCSGQMMTTTLKQPSECTDRELHDFASLVIEGGEVTANALHQRIKHAHLLAFAVDNGHIVSVAALKRPTPKHAGRFFTASCSDLSPDDYPFEYGWAVTKQSHRGRGFATELLDKLLESSKNQSIWATTKDANRSIQRILQKHGFKQAGRPFPGRNENLDLWTRKGSTQRQPG